MLDNFNHTITSIYIIYRGNIGDKSPSRVNLILISDAYPYPLEQIINESLYTSFIYIWRRTKILRLGLKFEFKKIYRTRSSRVWRNDGYYDGILYLYVSIRLPRRHRGDDNVVWTDIASKKRAYKLNLYAHVREL